MFIAAQYYRPPFPEKRYWLDDLSRMRDAGLDALQLWALWGWIEPEPGVFRFDDYDTLVEEADKRGLRVIISTIAEIQPFWIHRVVPDSHMVDHMGNKVISSLRGECNAGLTPGGCTDNPRVRELMAQFLRTISSHYAGATNIIGWDCWNETRWNVQADGYVCYCPHTLAAFREWLRERYGSLDGLNEAWRRRYCDWADVYPGKLPDRPYTEMMEFLRFLTWRAGRHMRFRYEELRRGGAKELISAHCAAPAIMSGGWGYEQTLCRGNDWDHADQLDGFGCSHFPFWGMAFDDTGFGMRVEAIRSAARGKTMWISELQGGSARGGHEVHPSVPARPQQRWVWNGYARGAKGVIFWCWRDEVFGRESSGFGLIGNDGLRDERLRAIAETSRVLDRYESLLDNYLPDDPKVGVLFEQDNYYLDWSRYGNAERAMNSLLGYIAALERLGVPYEVVESAHLGILSKLHLLLLPWPLVVREDVALRLLEFIRAGGTVLAEAELDAFTPLGFYRYPGPDRSFASALGIEDLGRRVITEDVMRVQFDGDAFELKPAGWITPFKPGDGEALAKDGDGNLLAFRRELGAGKVYALGSFPGMAYYRERYEAFERFLYKVVREARALPEMAVMSCDSEGGVVWRTGTSGNERLLFLINTGGTKEVKVDAPGSYFGVGGVVTELRSGRSFPVRREGDRGGFEILIEGGEWAVCKL